MMNKLLIARALVPVAAMLCYSAGTLAADEGEELFKSKPCVACHTVDSKLVGPGMKEVAVKYAGDEEAPARLADHIKNGTTGNWGQMPMPPNPVTEEEALTLANWVLSLK